MKTLLDEAREFVGMTNVASAGSVCPVCRQAFAVLPLETMDMNPLGGHYAYRGWVCHKGCYAALGLPGPGLDEGPTACVCPREA